MSLLRRRGIPGVPRNQQVGWDFFTPEKQVLEVFESREEANLLECRLILPELKNPNCLNEHCSPSFSPSVCSSNGRKSIGLMLEHPNTKEGRSKSGRMNVGTMNSHPNTIANRAEQGKSNVPLMNAHPNTKASRSKLGKKNVGFMNSQRWMNTDPNHPPKVSSPGALTLWQKARGIDTSLRVKIEG